MTQTLTRRLLRQWESPPVWLALFLGLVWAQARYLPLLPTGALGQVFGIGTVLAGLGVMALAVVQFRRHRTTVLPREVPTAMITTGIYAWSRNPIYLADAMILAGSAMMQDAGGLLAVPLFAAVIALRFIRGEEAGLRAAFGQAFDDWAARTRRWI